MREQLLLAQQVIGLARIGCLASDNSIRNSYQQIAALRNQDGSAMFPKTEARLRNLSARMLPGTNLCAEASKEIAAVVRPLNQRFRDEMRSKVANQPASNSLMQ